MNDVAEAAVAIITVGFSRDILLVRRADNPQDPWAGHWAFPGGRREEGESIIETCIRECEEECGILLAADAIRETLPISYAGLSMNRSVAVAPFHWHFEEAPVIKLDVTELQSSTYLPLDRFRNLSHHSSGRLAVAYPDRDYPYLELEGTPLWGFTYQVLHQWLDPK